MGSVNKFFVLTFIFLVLSSLMLFSVNFVNVCAVSKPSVPQFSVKLVDKSYDVPPAQTTDPYTGKTTTIPGYHVDNKTIDVTIKNQPFTPYATYDTLFYFVQVKGHFSEDWQNYDYGTFKQSDSQYTVVSVSAQSYAAGSQLDFRVKAAAGYKDDRLIYLPIVLDPEGISDWSKTQMFTVPSSSPSGSPSQTTNLPSVPPSDDPYNPPQQNPLWFYLSIVLATVCIIIIPIAIVTYLNKSHKAKAFIETP